MSDEHKKADELLQKLEILLDRQEVFSREITTLKEEISLLREEPQISSREEVIEKQEVTSEKKKNHSIENDFIPKDIPLSSQTSPTENVSTTRIKQDLEKFIGENLISKIGIVITVVGVAIGAKYSIENELISPLTRIILGYIAGIGLLAFAMKLKEKYESYSAVLVSGAMSILYFITYFAYAYYNLIPQALTFGLMVVFTSFTVIAALNYNRQLIAQLGLVGSYAVPFLLSDGSGNVIVMFSYMTIINSGILIISFKKYWKSLYYSSFGMTWLIYAGWYFSKYQMEDHFGLAMAFLVIFFITFYLTFLAYKLVRNETVGKEDGSLLLTNSFIFFGLGYSILSAHAIGQQFLGMFALGNAVMHFTASAVVYKRRLLDKSVLYLVSGLVLVFITISIPIQLDGNWVTLLWSGEAALLFWIGRKNGVPTYEKISYALMIIAFFSIIHDWTTVYDTYQPEVPELRIMPILNIHFISSVLFVMAFIFINFLNHTKKLDSSTTIKKNLVELMAIVIPGILLIGAYSSLWFEISNYFTQLYKDSALQIDLEGNDYASYYWDDDLNSFRSIWIINYSLIFFSCLAVFNFKKLRSQKVGLVSLTLLLLTLAVFLLEGLYELGRLRETYLQQTLSQYYDRGFLNIGIRYISFGLLAVATIVSYKYLIKEFLEKNLRTAFDLVLAVAILWITSSELIHWMDFAKAEQSYKLGLSILWGGYSLVMIAIGIWKRKKHLRVSAILIFGITLVKLFIYDMSDLNTIAKTIVFVALGVLLLLISFLYNKYKYLISDNNEE